MDRVFAGVEIGRQTAAVATPKQNADPEKPCEISVFTGGDGGLEPPTPYMRNDSSGDGDHLAKPRRARKRQ